MTDVTAPALDRSETDVPIPETLRPYFARAAAWRVWTACEHMHNRTAIDSQQDRAAFRAARDELRELCTDLDAIEDGVELLDYESMETLAGGAASDVDYRLQEMTAGGDLDHDRLAELAGHARDLHALASDPTVFGGAKVAGRRVGESEAI